MYGYDTVEKNGKYKERCYRVDKLNNIRILQQDRVGYDQFESFNANKFVSRRIGMFTGEEEKITLKIEKNKFSLLVDQFGKYVQIVDTLDDNHLVVSFNAVSSEPFLGWLIGLSKVEVLAPQSVREKIKRLLEENAKKY